MRSRFGLIALLAVAVFLTLGAILGCAKKEVQQAGSTDQMPQRSIEQVLKDHTDSLMAAEGVVGTAIGECDGKPCIKVFVVKKTPGLEKEIPSAIEGYPVSVEETGEIKALDTD